MSSGFSEKSINPFKNLNEAILKRVLKALKIKNRTELAERLGISRAAISDYTKNKWPTKRLEEIAHIANVSPEWLVHGEGHALKSNYCSPDECSIPVYGKVPAGGFSSIEDTPIEAINFNTLMKPKNLKNTLVIKVCGQSMNKLIPHGSYVAIKELEGEPIVDGAAYIIVVPQGITCKLVVLRKDGIVLKPCSSEIIYDDEFVSNEELFDKKVLIYKIINVLPNKVYLSGGIE